MLRDYRGFLQFLGLDEFLQSVQSKADPMSEVLQLWTMLQPNSANIGQLQHILEHIDRGDVLEDLSATFAEDIRVYLDEPNNRPIECSQTPVTPTKNTIDETTILTLSDVVLTEQGLPPTTFDAFILFHNDDIEFATMLIEKLEAFGLKVFVKERDLLAGSLESDATIRMLSERCGRLVVLLSTAFTQKQSYLDDFLLKYAQFSSFEQRNRKILPVCINEDVTMPSYLALNAALIYRPAGFYKFWERLRDSIRLVPSGKMDNADFIDAGQNRGAATFEDKSIIRPSSDSRNESKLGASRKWFQNRFRMKRRDKSTE